MLSQDTIVMRNNNVILGKVMEITATEVKYNKQEMPEGPLYIEKKADVKEVRYRNGFKEEFKMGAEETISTSKPTNNKIERHGPGLFYNGKRLTELELISVLKNSNDNVITPLSLKIERTNKLRHLGSLGIGCGGAAIVTAFSASFAYDERRAGAEIFIPSGIFAVSAIALGITGATYFAKHKNYRAKAIKLYNQKY